MNKPVNCRCGGQSKVDTKLVSCAPVERKRVYCSKCYISTEWMKSEAEAVEVWNTAMDVKDINIPTVIIEPFTTDMNHVGYCKCGYLVNAEWKYCPQCGARLEWNYE